MSMPVIKTNDSIECLIPDLTEESSGALADRFADLLDGLNISYRFIIVDINISQENGTYSVGLGLSYSGNPPQMHHIEISGLEKSIADYFADQLALKLSEKDYGNLSFDLTYNS